MNNDRRLQVGIDFSKKAIDICLMHPNGQPLQQKRYHNTQSGFENAKQLVAETLIDYDLEGVDISGEATGVYWLPLFLSMADDLGMQAYDSRLYLLNPRWIRWYKRSFARDNKTDERDAYYIADRVRVRKPQYTWNPHMQTMNLRFLTRHRFHLVTDLSREKTYFSAFMFLKANTYQTHKPFSDMFGQTSREILRDYLTMDEILEMPLDELTEKLQELSDDHFPDPEQNAQKLKRVAEDSLSLPEALAKPVQAILDSTLDHIEHLEKQIDLINTEIQEMSRCNPDVAILQSVPGLGPVFASGLAAEIGAVGRFLDGEKWDKRKKRYRPKNLRDAEDAVAKIAGLWWPKAESGGFAAEDRKMAKSGNKYLRYYLIQAADKMRRFIPEYKKYYRQKYKESTKHHHRRALVLTARKSVGLFVGLLHRQEFWRSEEERKQPD